MIQAIKDHLCMNFDTVQECARFFGKTEKDIKLVLDTDRLLATFRGLWYFRTREVDK